MIGFKFSIPTYVPTHTSQTKIGIIRIQIISYNNYSHNINSRVDIMNGEWKV